MQFYDNNFFLREEHARELADRIAPLKLRWWCEARVDIVLGYSDDTLRKLRAAGCVMIFFGVESGTDQALRDMKKQLTAEQTVELARRIREFGIVPEYSMIFGNPADAERDLAANIAFVAPHQEGQPRRGNRSADVRADAAAQWRLGRRGSRLPRARPMSGLPTTGTAS